MSEEAAVPHRALYGELLLLYHDPVSGRPLSDGTHLACGLAGAMVAELTLNGHLSLDEREYLGHTGSPPTGDPHLDTFAGEVAARKRPRKARWWIQRTQSGRLRTGMLGSAVEQGLLDHEQSRVLLVFPLNRYRPHHPQEREDLHFRLRAVLRREQAPDEWTAALLALCGAVGADRRLFPDLSGRERRRLLKQATEDVALGAAVAAAIQSIHTATAAATTAATTAAAGGS